MVEIRGGFEASTRSSIFPESNRVGSLTIFVNPNSPIISISLLCLAAVCAFVEHNIIFSQLMSGRLKSPARMTGKRFSREGIFAGRYFRERIFSREDIFAGRLFSREQYIRENISNSLFAKFSSRENKVLYSSLCDLSVH